MSPPVTPWMMWAGCLCLCAAVVFADSAEIYGKLGGEVILIPEDVPLIGSNTRIQWKMGPNIAIDFDGEINPMFEGRVHLNTSTGAMTLTGLLRADSGVYTTIFETSNKIAEGRPITLTVISAVPAPTVTKSCDKKMTRCTLTCAGNTTGAEPVSYVWREDDEVLSGSSASIEISEELSSHVKDFTCELKNNVSQESSQLLSNPFFKDTATSEPPERDPKIAMGVTVFVVLLSSVTLLVIFHRWKSGMWFFQKDSMPWQADFWRSQNGRPQGAAVSNGNPGHQQRTDEETPMT